MFKLIWKNLWARRPQEDNSIGRIDIGEYHQLGLYRTRWIVVTQYRNIPLGYDAERLCLISLGALQPGTGIDAEAQDSATLVDNYYNLVRYVKDFDGVESATPVLGFCYPKFFGKFE